jgi:hypothetical protein
VTECDPHLHTGVKSGRINFQFDNKNRVFFSFFLLTGLSDFMKYDPLNFCTQTAVIRLYIALKVYIFTIHLDLTHVSILKSLLSFSFLLPIKKLN